MNAKARIRDRMNVALQMIMAFIAAILLVQLWLFTVALDAMENGSVPLTVSAATILCSLVACVATWMLIRLFLNTEQNETGERP
jgi:hypothetical protein